MKFVSVVLLAGLCMTVVVYYVACLPAANVAQSVLAASPKGTDRSPPKSSSSDHVALLSMRGGQSDGGEYFVVKGIVKNVGEKSIDHLTALVNVYDKNGDLITYESALVEYVPLLPSQESPFTVGVRWNPAIHTYAVTFKRLMGGQIAMDDLTAGKKAR